jgi:hypothetical protein
MMLCSIRPRTTWRFLNFQRLVLLLASACGIAHGQVTGFTITASGPHHVVQGYYTFVMVSAKITSGVDENGTIPSVSGLPSGATAQFVNMARYCCGTQLYRLEQENPVRISTSSSTPVGTYPLQIIYRTPEGVQRSTTYTLYVDPVPTLTQKTGTYFPADTPLASLAAWNANMLFYGLQHCTPIETAAYNQSSVSYYDGARVYYQVADLTGNSAFNTCAGMVYASYSKYVNDNNGGIPGYEVFPQGLALRFQRTGDSAARQTLTTLRANTPYTSWPDTSYIINWNVSREISYGIETNLVDQSLGGPQNPHFQDLVEALFGHFDQWFQTKSATIVQPFMVALAAEALIQYWDVSHDPRVPPTLQMAADQIWAQSWDRSCNCFRYYDDVALDGTYSLSLDLNLLIAPLYGWVYHQTGFKGYRDQGDQIFNAGVAGAWLDGGKQFSQSYRWSGQYVQWRSSPPSSPPVQSQTVRSCDLNSDGAVNVLDVQLGTNQALGNAACGTGDLNGDGSCSIVDVMRIVNTSLGATCNTAP